MSRRRKRFLTASLAAFALIVPGCASKSGGWFGGGNAVPAGYAQNSPVPFFQGKQSPVIAQNGAVVAGNPGSNPAAPSSPTSLTAAATGAASSMGDMVRRAGSAMSNALTIDPKTMPADDAVSLASMPKKISYDLYLEAGKMCERNGNFDGAAQQYEKALRAAPRNTTVLRCYARLHDRQGQFEQAEKLYQKAAQLEPINSAVVNDYGLCLARQKKYSEAVDWLQKAVALQPDKQLYRNNLAMVFVEQEKHSEALAQLKAVHSEAAAHYHLGQMLQSRQQAVLAADHLRRAAELSPEFAVPVAPESNSTNATTKLAGLSNSPLDASANNDGTGTGTTNAAPQPPRFKVSEPFFENAPPQTALPNSTAVPATAPLSTNLPTLPTMPTTAIPTPPAATAVAPTPSGLLMPPPSALTPSQDSLSTSPDPASATPYPTTGYGGPPLSAPNTVPSADATFPSDNVPSFPSLLPPVEPSR